MSKPCFLSQVKKFPFSQDEIADIWKLAKENYIDQGKTFEETISGMADDLGMRKEHVAQAFTEPKTIRHISNDMWSKMQARRDAVTNARRVVEGLNAPEFMKKLDAAYNVPRSALTFGHGGVFPMTHMGDFVFVPEHWRTFFQASTSAWGFFGKAGEKRYEIALQRHLADPDYIWARRGSKSVDISQETVGILNNMKGWSSRGFNTLKIARLALFKTMWKNIPEAERNTANAKAIMSVVDSSTGEVHLPGNVGQWLSKFLFAPKLLPARFKTAIIDPVQAVKTFATWDKASAGERQAARYVAKRSAQVISFYAAALAVNQGLNSAFGSKDKVNFTDPVKGDWLSFKIGGVTLRPPNAIIEVLRLAGGITAAYLDPHHGQHPEQSAGAKVTDYLRYKLHPTFRIAGEAVSGLDMFRNKLPFPGLKELATGKTPKIDKGKHEIAIPEYIAGKGPIFIGGGVREYYDLLREEGMSHLDAKKWIRVGAITAVESEGVSAHEVYATPDNEKKSKKAPARTF